MASTSIFRSFPPPPGKGQITVFEQIGELNHVSQDQAKLKLQGYPDVSVNKDSTRSLTQRENAKSAFLPHDETVTKRVYHAWQDMGMSGALEEIVNDAEQGQNKNKYVLGYFMWRVMTGQNEVIEYLMQIPVPEWISAVAHKLLVLSRWTGSLHGSFFPHLALSNEDIVSRFSSIVHWNTSPIKALSWHPHTLKFSYALQDDTVRVHANFTELVSSLKHTELVPILKHKLQKNIACLAWQPNSSSVLAVGCQSCILIWHVEPTSLATRPSSSSVQVLQKSGHCPVTSLSWSPDGHVLMSASPVDTAVMAWDVALETCIPLRRFGGGGVSLVSWSPDGSKLFSATPSNLFRVWETRTWNCEKWSTSTGPCKTACWSPNGNVLLFATENQPIIYSLTFSEVSDETKAVIGGSQTAMACVDLSETDLQIGDSAVKVGGLIQHMCWDAQGERLAVVFQGNCDYVAVFRTKLYPLLEITPCGLVKGLDGETSEFIQFQPNYSKGAMLIVIWSSGRVGYVPMYFVSSAVTSSVSPLEEELKFQQHQHTFSSGLYSATEDTFCLK